MGIPIVQDADERDEISSYVPIGYTKEQDVPVPTSSVAFHITNNSGSLYNWALPSTSLWHIRARVSNHADETMRILSYPWFN